MALPAGTVLYLRANTDLSDGSDSAHGIATAGSGTTISSTAKFGAGSASFDGSTNGYAYWADSVDWAFGTGDFAIGFWVRPSSTSFGTLYHIVGQHDQGGGGVKRWRIYLECSVAGQVFIKYQPMGGSVIASPGSFAWDTTDFHYFEINRVSGALYFYGDTNYLSTEADANDITDGAQQLTIGAVKNGASYIASAAYRLDELVVLKGSYLRAEEAGGITPPTSQYIADLSFRGMGLLGVGK